MQKALECHHSRKDFVQVGDNSNTADTQVHIFFLLLYSIINGNLTPVNFGI